MTGPTIPYDYPGTVPTAEVVAKYEHLAPGEESGDVVRVAGRIMLLRVQGKLVFATLRDWSGAVQLFCLEASTEGFEELKRTNLGDWIGAEGAPVRTRRGELSVKVTAWALLARALHGFGDKWRGVSDPDVRFRQREVDMWANEGVRDRFLLRSRVIASLRHLLAERGFVEVETPVFQPIP
ncbi:MAG: OB-fold nucleic acid binding domain-containing protein, partial [Acidimicrobiales bacterium]